MSLTRKLLESMGLETDKVSTIIEAHAETVDALKAKIEDYKADAEKLKEVQKSLDSTTKELEKLKSDGGTWQDKYNQEHEAFEEYKKTQTAKEELSAKEKAYSDLLKKAGVSDKRIDSIIKITDLKEKALVDGKFENEEDILSGIKEEWSDFITKTSIMGAQTSTPPQNNGGAKLTRADIYKKDDKGRYVMSAGERQKAIAENPDAFVSNE